MQTWQREWGNMDENKLIAAMFLLADEIHKLRAELKNSNAKEMLQKEKNSWREKADLLVAQMNDRKQRGDC